MKLNTPGDNEVKALLMPLIIPYYSLGQRTKQPGIFLQNECKMCMMHTVSSEAPLDQ